MYAPHFQTHFLLHLKTSEGFYTLIERTGSYNQPLSSMQARNEFDKYTSIILIAVENTHLRRVMME